MKLVALLWLVCACTPVIVEPREPVVVPVGSDDCETACRYWRALTCPEGEPSRGGVACEEVCRNAAVNGIDIAKQLSCASTATTCAALRACPY